MSLQLIQKLYNSDIRSMINFMQSKQNIVDDSFNIIDDSVWDNLYKQFEVGQEHHLLVNFIDTASSKYNIGAKNIIKDFLNYIIRKYERIVTPEYLNFIENIMNFEDCKNSYYINYATIRLSSLIKKP